MSFVSSTGVRLRSKEEIELPTRGTRTAKPAYLPTVLGGLLEGRQRRPTILHYVDMKNYTNSTSMGSFHKSIGNLGIDGMGCWARCVGFFDDALSK
jgi:hypothetical protein